MREHALPFTFPVGGASVFLVKLARGSSSLSLLQRLPMRKAVPSRNTAHAICATTVEIRRGLVILRDRVRTQYSHTKRKNDGKDDSLSTLLQSVVHRSPSVILTMTLHSDF